MQKVKTLLLALTIATPVLYSMPSYAANECDSAIHCLQSTSQAQAGKYFNVQWPNAHLGGIVCLPLNFSIPLDEETIKVYNINPGEQTWVITQCQDKTCSQGQGVAFLDSFLLSVVSGPNSTYHTATPQKALFSPNPNYGESCTPINAVPNVF